MEETQAERTANMALAEARVANVLLMELLDTLETRGLVTRADIAAALLRMEWRATVADVLDETEGDITHHAQIAKLTIDEWETRFGLPPELFALRKAQQEWIAQGSSGESPLYPKHVIASFSGEGE
ncbi:hypothetical protein [Brucella inopinata]|uniref:hypothetical protein n=1 Tax=Brucella inopinata TaxID=1218315 RepID=UPI000870FF6C|nr:hypothetical protein [Brucella inopinata]SCD23661.1 hypothetical protein BR141012304_11242 [Brucella inopinata]